LLERKLLLSIAKNLKAVGVFMVCLFYKDHAIVTSGRPAGSVEEPVGYLPVAVISWSKPDLQRQVMHTLKSQKVYDTPEEASATALEQAKAWVHHHDLHR
jgi:hypothetical protein